MEGTVAVTKQDQFKWRIIEDFRLGKIRRKEAAEILGLSERSVQRIAKRHKAEGIAGLVHKNRCRTPANKKPEDLKRQALDLASRLYYDFNMTHCCEQLAKFHGIEVSYSVFRRWCREAGIGKHKRRRASKARLYRDRMGNEGLLLQLDGSHHKWNGKDDWVLIGAIDDATSEMPYVGFYRAEETLNCMDVLRKIIEIRGLPEALYVDKAGWFGGTKRQHFSQFSRACDELGIRVIYAHSPQAKGRIERAWKTFQDRLIPELRLHGIKALDEANKYLHNHFMPDYWHKQNIIVARDEQSRYRHLPNHTNLDQIFCFKHSRLVSNSHTFSFNNVCYRITGGLVGSLARKPITLIERQQGPLEAYYGHIKLEIKPLPALGRNSDFRVAKKKQA